MNFQGSHPYSGVGSFSKLNITDEEKEELSFHFAKKYKDDLEAFLKYINDPIISVPGDYRATWDYIKQDNHSLERHTNLSLCFKEITKSDISTFN